MRPESTESTTPLHNVKDNVLEYRAHDNKASGLRHLFQKFAQKTAAAVGTPSAFLIAALIIVAWAITGPMFHYSDTWQLVINTGTTIVTFLMVFLIQNTQNRDAKAIHLKLDELIRAKHGARNKMVDLENCTDEELAEIEREFKRVRRRAERAGGREQVIEPPSAPAPAPAETHARG
jgi:low affinity Fe/Cu permease